MKFVLYAIRHRRVEISLNQPYNIVKLTTIIKKLGFPKIIFSRIFSKCVERIKEVKEDVR